MTKSVARLLIPIGLLGACAPLRARLPRKNPLTVRDHPCANYSSTPPTRSRAPYRLDICAGPDSGRRWAGAQVGQSFGSLSNIVQPAQRGVSCTPWLTNGNDESFRRQVAIVSWMTLLTPVSLAVQFLESDDWSPISCRRAIDSFNVQHRLHDTPSNDSSFPWT
jgi:hypothetical protein